MGRWKLTIEYHGGPFVGWQRQESHPSAQQALEEAARRLDPSVAHVIGAGRTDAGVHALGQVAHLDMSRDWEPFRLRAALNHHLSPAPIAVTAAQLVRDDFHARFDAVERGYLYRILDRPAPATVDRGLVWRVARPLDVAAMNAAARALVGHHDFTTFRASQCQALSPLKTLDALDVARVGAEARVRARARSFLHNQVRSMVGALVEVGLGRWDAERLRGSLAARSRAACARVAPPDGLYLEFVRYPEPEETPR